MWWRIGHHLLSPRVRDRLEAGEDDVFISVVSAWEYGHKRLKWPGEFDEPFAAVVASLPHAALDLSYGLHGYAETLPPIHGDPFDRMLVAQAIHHDLTLVASDETIHRYPVEIFW